MVICILKKIGRNRMNIAESIRKVKQNSMGNIDFHKIDIMGSHILYMFNDKEKYIQNAVDFIAEGLQNKDRILLVDDKQQYTSIIFQLVKLGYSEEEIGSITFHTMEDFYFGKENFNVGKSMKQLKEIFENSSKHGKRVRTWGHVLVDQSSVSELRKYESEVDKIISGENVISVCAYHAMTIPAFYQNELLKVHEYVMIDDQLVKSNFYNRKHIEFSSSERDRLQNLEKENDQLREKNERLIRHSAHQLEREKSLEMEKVNAERSNYAKSMFLSQMSHDLRTPLNTIQGYAQILMMNEHLDSDSLYKTKKIFSSSEQLLHLIEEILDFASLDMGQVKIKKEEVPLFSFLTDCVETIRETNTSYVNIQLEDVHPDWSIEVDPIRFHQIIMNLLDNAIKYNRPNGYVKIFCENENEDEVKILVEDSGFGIDELEKDLIFEPFFRSKTTMDRWKGTGLGLAIVAQLASRMDGNYGVLSKKGKGSTFWVSFKKTKVTNLSSKDRKLNGEEKDAFKHQVRVLYIEDHQENIDVMQSMLQVIKNVKLDFALTAKEGIKKISEVQPHVIFLDLSLPDRNGFEVLARIKSDPMTKDLPVVVVSADALETTINRAYEEGIYKYMTKPINFYEVKEILTKVSRGFLLNTPSIY